MNYCTTEYPFLYTLNEFEFLNILIYFVYMDKYLMGPNQMNRLNQSSSLHLRYLYDFIQKFSEAVKVLKTCSSLKLHRCGISAWNSYQILFDSSSGLLQQNLLSAFVGKEQVNWNHQESFQHPCRKFFLLVWERPPVQRAQVLTY